jgi:chromosome segregation ATPase
MSQTETLMLVVLGFALAALIALFIGRFAWHLALRLGAKRMQRQVPSTVTELQSERDRLRAEYAMLSRKLDLRLSDIKMRMAEQMAEVTRNRNRVETLTGEVKKRDAELETWREQAATLEARLMEMTRANEALSEEVGQLNSEIAGLRISLGERDERITALNTELADATSLAEALAPPPEDIADPLARKIDKLALLSEAIAEERAADLPLAEAQRETGDLERELARLDRNWSEKLTELENAEDGSGPGKTRKGGDIVSLTRRLKALQKDAAR